MNEQLNVKKKKLAVCDTCQFNLFLSTEEQNHQARGEEAPEGGSKKVIGSTNKHFEKTYPCSSVLFYKLHGWKSMISVMVVEEM